MKHRRPGRREKYAMPLVAPIVLFAVLCAASGDAIKPENRWEKDICAFERQDEKTPPPKNAILFIGSSSIRMWDIPKSFPDLAALNRGFGGSTVADVNLYFDRIVKPYAPSGIVFYSGDNDLASGKTPEAVLDDFRRFIEQTHAAFPGIDIVIYSLRPTTARWNIFEQQTAVNDGLAKIAESDERVFFLGCNDILLDSTGKPREDYLLKDKLHLNEAGYAAWADRLRPFIEKLQAKP